jgi:DnaK suppressor protein
MVEGKLGTILAILKSRESSSGTIFEKNCSEIASSESAGYGQRFTGEFLGHERRRLEAAVRRLENGTFGICCSCDEPMERETLNADPGAPFCDACREDMK